MKKRLTLVIAIIMIILTTAICLVGCAPSRPDKFVERLLVSNNWGVTMFNSKGEQIGLEARNGSLRYSYGVKASQYILVGKTLVETFKYTNSSGEWSYTMTDDKDSVDQLRTSILNSNPSEITYSNGLDLKYIKNDFLTKFEKKNGKWYEKNTMPACLYVKGNSLYYEKNDMLVILTMGFNLTLPKEALQSRPGAED